MILPLIGPQHDIPAPGKDLGVGGAYGRREATGRGAVIVAQEILNRLGRDLPGTTVAVQGFGNVGSVAALLLHERGAMVGECPTSPGPSTTPMA